MYKTLKYFDLSEFSCRCGCTTPPQAQNALRAVCASLQVLRLELKSPVIINSGYRCTSHNAKVGGASRSFHLSGMASDIVVSGISSVQVFRTLLHLMETGQILKGGIKDYGTFVHYDIRGTITKF